MNKDTFRISRTSFVTASVDPMVIRATDTTRLVFIPEIIKNPNDPKACIKGTFAYQRKKNPDEWENLSSSKLTSLKSGEGVAWSLHSEELRMFLLELWNLYKIHASDGLPKGESDYIRVNDHQKLLLELGSQGLSELLQKNPESAKKLATDVFTWLAAKENNPALLAALMALKDVDASQLTLGVKISSLKRLKETWEENKENADEEFWQTQLHSFPYAFSLILPYSAIIHQGKAYVGGKTYENTGGNIADFLIGSKIGGNCAVVEIKTPVTRLTGKAYRGSAYAISEETSGAVVQLKNYMQKLTENSAQSGFLPGGTTAYSPQGILICGTLGSLNEAERKSLELFRNGLKNVYLVTYDEFFDKADALIKLLEE